MVRKSCPLVKHAEENAEQEEKAFAQRPADWRGHRRRFGYRPSGASRDGYSMVTSASSELRGGVGGEPVTARRLSPIFCNAS